MVKKIHKKKEKVKAEKMSKDIRTASINERLAMIRMMTPEDVIKTKHTYFGNFCKQARHTIDTLEPKERIEYDFKFLRLATELQPKLNTSKGLKNAFIYDLMISADEKSKIFDTMPDKKEVLSEIDKVMREIANFDTQDQPKA